MIEVALIYNCTLAHQQSEFRIKRSVSLPFQSIVSDSCPLEMLRRWILAKCLCYGLLLSVPGIREHPGHPLLQQANAFQTWGPRMLFHTVCIVFWSQICSEKSSFLSDIHRAYLQGKPSGKSCSLKKICLTENFPNELYHKTFPLSFVYKVTIHSCQNNVLCKCRSTVRSVCPLWTLFCCPGDIVDMPQSKVSGKQRLQGLCWIIMHILPSVWWNQDATLRSSRNRKCPSNRANIHHYVVAAAGLGEGGLRSPKQCQSTSPSQLRSQTSPQQGGGGGWAEGESRGIALIPG